MNVVTSGGVSFIGLLQLTFIILKLCNVINWSWLIVCIPLIVGASIIGLIILIMIIHIIIDAIIG